MSTIKIQVNNYTLSVEVTEKNGRFTAKTSCPERKCAYRFAAHDKDESMVLSRLRFMMNKHLS